MPFRADDAFAAIADPHRRQIIDLLATGDRTAGQVAASFAISRPAVAKHLKILQDQGIVLVRRQGRERINRLNPAALKPVRDWVAQYDRFWDERLAALKRQVEDR